MPTVIQERQLPVLADLQAAVERAGGVVGRPEGHHPRVAHAETITTFHTPAFMADPRAANCVLDGNPLHEEQLAIVEMLGGARSPSTR